LTSAQAGGESVWYELWGSEVLFRFPVVKLLDYQQWSALRPAGTLCYSGHGPLESPRDPLHAKSVLNGSWLLPDGCMKKVMGEDVINLFGFIDWVMSLPES